MKASIKLREERQSPLLRAKLPVSILRLPFITSVCAGDPADLSFHLRTSSSSGPSLKLSYYPNCPHAPFSLTVRTGIGPFGSPDSDSPLLMSAHFSLLGASFPSFTFQIKPQFGDFSLKKVHASPAASLPTPVLPVPNKPNGDSHVADVVGNGPLLGELRAGGVGILSGMAVNARTVLPVTRKAMVKFRWGVNFNERKLPFLTVDKIGVERVEEESKKRSSRSSNDDSMGKTAGELEVLRGMCFWMGREVEALQRENRSMKECIEELRSGTTRREIEIPSKKPMETADSSSDFDRWRKEKNGGVEDRKAEGKPGSTASGATANDVGEELKRALKAAAAV